jgi:hypothetical protein
VRSGQTQPAITHLREETVSLRSVVFVSGADSDVSFSLCQFGLNLFLIVVSCFCIVDPVDVILGRLLRIFESRGWKILLYLRREYLVEFFVPGSGSEFHANKSIQIVCFKFGFKIET